MALRLEVRMKARPYKKGGKIVGPSLVEDFKDDMGMKEEVDDGGISCPHD